VDDVAAKLYGAIGEKQIEVTDAISFNVAFV